MPFVPFSFQFTQNPCLSFEVYVLYHYLWYTIDDNHMIQIVTGDARPIFKQIVDGIRMQIMTGQLAVGAKLPSVRGLSVQLTVNTNTVAKAYSELLSHGLVESRKGLGLFVIQPKQILSDQEREQRLEKAVDALIHETIGLSFSHDDILQLVTKKLSKLPDGNTE